MMPLQLRLMRMICDNGYTSFGDLHAHTHTCVQSCIHSVLYPTIVPPCYFNDTESKNMQYVARERQKMSVSGQ